MFIYVDKVKDIYQYIGCSYEGDNWDYNPYGSSTSSSTSSTSSANNYNNYGSSGSSTL